MKSRDRSITLMRILPESREREGSPKYLVYIKKDHLAEEEVTRKSALIRNLSLKIRDNVERSVNRQFDGIKSTEMTHFQKSLDSGNDTFMY